MTFYEAAPVLVHLHVLALDTAANVDCVAIVK